MNKFIKVTPNIRYFNDKQIRINTNCIISYYDYDMEDRSLSVIFTTKDFLGENELLVVKESVKTLDRLVGVSNVLDPIEMD